MSGTHDEGIRVDISPSRRTLAAPKVVNSSYLVRSWPILRCFAWVPVSFACLLLSYLLVWQRGFYFDDYNNRFLASNVVTGDATPIWSHTRYVSFPARMLSWTINTGVGQVLASSEFWVRLIEALGIAANAILLGWLIYRVLGSRLAALIGGWLFLVPVYAYEALLWAGAIGYIGMVLLALLFMHACWSAFAAFHRIRHWTAVTNLRPSLQWAGVATLCFVTMLLIAESYVTILGLVPLFGFAFALRYRHAGRRAMVRRALFVAAWPTGICAVVYMLFYRDSGLEAQRGGLDLSATGLVFRTEGYFDRLRWMTVSDQWGRHLTGDVLGLGREVVFASWKGTTLYLASWVLMFVVVLTWRTRAQDYAARYPLGVLLLVLGLVWAVVTLLLPAVLAKGQILEYRMLYFPTGGLGVAVGALIWLTMKTLGRWRPVGERVCVAVVGLYLLVSTIPMAGFTYALAARSRLDQKQIAAVTQAIPSQYLPQNSYMVPFGLDEHIPVHGEYVNALLVGVFDAPHSANAALETVYRRTDLISLTMNRWVGMRFSDAGGQLTVQGAPVPVERTVLYTLRGEKVVVIERLTIKESDGTQQVIAFPVAQTLRQHGVPTITNLTVTNNVPAYMLPPAA